MESVEQFVELLCRLADQSDVPERRVQCQRLRHSLVSFAASLSSCRDRARRRQHDMEVTCKKRREALHRVEDQLARLQGALDVWADSTAPPDTECMQSMADANRAHLAVVKTEQQQLETSLRAIDRQAKHDALLAERLASSAVAAHFDWMRTVADELGYHDLSRHVGALGIVVASGYGPELLDYIVLVWTRHKADAAAETTTKRERVTPDDLASRPAKRRCPEPCA